MPPPPSDESTLEKMERISSTIKTSRNEISDILYSDTNPEDKIIRSMEIQRESLHIVQLYKVIQIILILRHLDIVTLIIVQEVEDSEDACKPEIAEILAKCKAGLIDYQANVNTIDFNKFATDMKNEQEFLNGLNKQLKPWMDGAEVTANDALKKPGNFEEAREIESQCVKFAKEVRKANKLLGKIDEAKKLLARYQTTAEQQIEEQVGEMFDIKSSSYIAILIQRMRFKKIASVAASRVEQMRDLLIR